jgi:hypothetical protein
MSAANCDLLEHAGNTAPTERGMHFETFFREELSSAIDALAAFRFEGSRERALDHALTIVEREIESSPLWKATGGKVIRAVRLLSEAAKYPNVTAFAKARGVEPEAMRQRLHRARADLRRIKQVSVFPSPKARPRGRPRDRRGR